MIWGNTVIWGNQTDTVWDHPQTWASTVIWGNTVLGLGAAADGTVDWSSVGPTTVIWGNLTP